MKIIYISPTTFPSTSAHSIYSMKIAEALALNGHEVTLIIKCNKNTDVSNLYNEYGVIKNFKIKPFSKASFPGAVILKTIQIVLFLIIQKKDIIISSDFRAAGISVFLRNNLILDAHGLNKENKIYKLWLNKKLCSSKHLLKVIVTTRSLEKIFADRGVPLKKIYVVRNGNSKNSDVRTIGSIVSENKLNVGYVGHLYQGKGIEVIAAVAPLLPLVNFHIVGGRAQEIEYWKSKLSYPNVIFYGFISPKDLPPYLNSFDICLLPNQNQVKGVGNRDIGEVTCPLKMFEYMSHKKPIIASDLPVLKEVLDETMALFCNPENPLEWVKAIELLQNNMNMRMELAFKAYNVFINNYTWQKRAEKMVA